MKQRASSAALLLSLALIPGMGLAQSDSAANTAPAHTKTLGPAQTAVLATVQQFADGFNKGDTKRIVAACVDQTVILDEFPPYVWHGSGACAKWVSDFDADAQKNGITEPVVTLRHPTHVDITADRAYVIPTDFAFRLKGKPASEIGAIMTLTLQNTQSGWRITGWAWAKH